MIVKPFGAPSALASRLGLLVVVSFFCWPLFIGLGQWDLRNDEAIYSYSVDRFQETHEWLTPRSIQVDGPFLEKPPLKFWIVAGLIGAGVLPHDERGLRFVDALFGAVAFVYVYALGRRLAGPICGVIAVFVLFTLDRLVFDHGLRSNNMEAALVLAYCGGVYHFARWEEQSGARGRWKHPMAVGAYFVLGFMTKFVAALFLPLVCGVAFAWRQDAWSRVRAHWRDWLAPLLLVVVLTAPWFVYETLQFGNMFWEVILGEHIYTRFTAALDPMHLQPWHFYYVETWKALSLEGSHWVAAAGALMLTATAIGGQPWLARLLFIWWALPFALLSLGTSKLFHYIYPFLPAIAIGAGYVSAVLSRLLADVLVKVSRDRLRVPALATLQHRAASSARARAALAAGAALAFGLAAWTIAAGNVVWIADGQRVFRNSSVVRPIVVGGALLWLRASTGASAQAFAVLPLLALLPVNDYHPTLEFTTDVNHPLRTLRDCARDVQRSGAEAGQGVYNAARPLVHRSYYYYLRGLGPWAEADRPDREELERRLRGRGAQTPVLISTKDYRAAVAGIDSPGAPPPAEVEASFSDAAVSPTDLTVLTVDPEENVVILLPGPYSTCFEKVLEAGGRLVADDAMRETGR